MNRIRPRSRGHVDRARRRQLVRKIQARLAELKFLNATRRNIHRRRSHRFIRYVDAIHFNARRPPEPPAERNRRIPCLRRIEVLPILNLHARLQLRQVQKVTPVHRQVLDLLRAQHSLHDRLLCVHLHRRALHLDHLTFLSDLQLHVSVCRVSHQDGQTYFRLLEAPHGHPRRVPSGDQRSRVVRPRGIRREADDLPRRYIGDRDLSPR